MFKPFHNTVRKLILRPVVRPDFRYPAKLYDIWPKEQQVQPIFFQKTEGSRVVTVSSSLMRSGRSESMFLLTMLFLLLLLLLLQPSLPWQRNGSIWEGLESAVSCGEVHAEGSISLMATRPPTANSQHTVHCPYAHLPKGSREPFIY